MYNARLQRMDNMLMSITKTQDTVSPSIAGILRAISPTGRNRLLQFVGDEFKRMTLSNFGSSGRYRSRNWPQLSPEYAKEKGSSIPTDKRTGQLYASIKMSSPKDNYINIYTKCPYAASVAYGNKNTPARCFWPVEYNGSPTYSRLVYNADKDLQVLIGKKLNVLSSGALPYLSSAIIRSRYEYGNPFTAPQNKGN